MEPSMHKPKKQQKPLSDLSRSLIPFDPNQTLTAVVELSKRKWLVAGIIPGVERQPLKKLAADENQLLMLLERWRAEAEKAGHKITRIAIAFETDRDGFWLARWLRKRGIEAHVIHAASVPVSRRRCGLAAHCVCAAAQTQAADRSANEFRCGRPGSNGPHRGICGGIAAKGLDQWSELADRLSLAG
jgi:hypothetical protein